MAKEKLTKRSIEQMVYSKQPSKNSKGKTTYPQDIRWDTELDCFGVRVYSSGKKTFVVFYRVENKQRIQSLGRYGIVTVDEARKLARITLARALQGEDPAGEKKRQRSAADVSALCDIYLERYAKERKKSWRDDESRINKYIRPKLGAKAVENVSKKDIAALHSEIGREYPYAANRTLELLARMFALAPQWGFLDEGASNPAKGIPSFQEIKRDRYVTQEELPRLAKAMAGESETVQAAIWMYLLTGLRKQELLRLRWSDVDMERLTICVRQTKNGEPHDVPLNGPAIEILSRLSSVAEGEYIFPGRNGEGHMVNIDKLNRHRSTRHSPAVL